MKTAEADCEDCGHCVEMYTPSPDDDPALTVVRTAVYDWLNNIFFFLVRIPIALVRSLLVSWCEVLCKRVFDISN